MAQHNNTGFWREQLACDYLISQGYQALYRNHIIGRLELDLVVQQQNNHGVKKLIIVEVKTRSRLNGKIHLGRSHSKNRSA